jgi:serine/threonine-protein kinase
VPELSRSEPSKPRADAPKRLDTVAVVERAAAPREIPLRTALTIIVSLSLTAGLLTWLVRLLAN